MTNVSIKDVAKWMFDANILVTLLMKYEKSLEKYYMELLGGESFKMGIETDISIKSLLGNSVDGGQRGFELFLQRCSDFNSLISFFIGIYVGIHVTGAFEERKIQAAVMVGNSASTSWQ